MKIVNGRLEAKGIKLTKADFDIIAQELSLMPGFAVKLGDKPVAAMNIVSVPTPIITINTKDGSLQADNTAQPGDAVMTRLDKSGKPILGATGELDQWVVTADNLQKLYNPLPLDLKSEYGQVVGGCNEVYYVELPKGGIIEAPWGGPQEISDGVLQYSITTDEVYLNETDAFKATFDIKTLSKPIEDPGGQFRFLRENKSGYGSGQWGVDTIQFAEAFEEAANDSLDQAAGILIEAARAFTEANNRNGDVITEKDGLNRALGFLSYHNVSNRHTETGKAAISAAERRLEI